MKLIAVLKSVIVDNRVLPPKTLIDSKNPVYETAVKQYPVNNRFSCHDLENIKESHAVIVVDVTEDNEADVRKALVDFLNASIKDGTRKPKGATRLTVKNSKDAEVEKVVQTQNVTTKISSKETVVTKETVVSDEKPPVEEVEKIPAQKRTRLKESNPKL
jgi:hypothetical protein